MKKQWLYTLVIISCITGSLWVYWNLHHYNNSDPHSGVNLCLFKRVTGIPCPSCGSTRSLLFLSHLDFKDALYANPIGFILALGILVFPLWVLYDLAARKSSFYIFYRNTESFVTRRWVAVSLICLVAANWCWNIYKCY